MSKSELKRAAELCLLQTNGHISCLKFQPRFDLVVEGVKITTYVADFQYTENGSTVVEDTKPSGEFMDDIAKFKIALFNALHVKHGIKILISRR